MSNIQNWNNCNCNSKLYGFITFLKKIVELNASIIYPDIKKPSQNAVAKAKVIINLKVKKKIEQERVCSTVSLNQWKERQIGSSAEWQ